MPTHNYKLADGTRVPGVTTVIGRFKEAGPLMDWAWNEGREGRDYRETRQGAADIGTCAHAMVEADIHGIQFDPSPFPPEIAKAAQQPFEAYCKWRDQSRMMPVATEVYLVSETLRVGGCMDAIMVDDQLCVGDWKSSNAIYGDMLIQLAAYRGLWEEAFPDRPLTGGFHLVRFAKDHPDFEHRYFGELEEAWRAFKMMRDLYEIDKGLKKRAR